jgi:hypothetical protein
MVVGIIGWFGIIVAGFGACAVAPLPPEPADSVGMRTGAGAAVVGGAGAPPFSALGLDEPQPLSTPAQIATANRTLVVNSCMIHISESAPTEPENVKHTHVLESSLGPGNAGTADPTHDSY